MSLTENSKSLELSTTEGYAGSTTGYIQEINWYIVDIKGFKGYEDGAEVED